MKIWGELTDVIVRNAAETNLIKRNPGPLLMIK